MTAAIEPAVSRCEICRWWKPIADPALNQGECWRYPPTVVSRTFNAGCDESLENHRPVTVALDVCGEFKR